MRNLVLALVAATVVAAPAAAQQPPAACPANAISTVTGSGSGTSHPFHSDVPFEVQWSMTAKVPEEEEGMLFQVILFSKAGKFVDLLANQLSNDPGSAFSPKAGDYYVRVIAMFDGPGQWRVCVVPAP